MSLDDDVLRGVKVYAGNRDITLGKAVSELVRKGLNAPFVESHICQNRADILSTR